MLFKNKTKVSGRSIEFESITNAYEMRFLIDLDGKSSSSNSGFDFVDLFLENLKAFSVSLDLKRREMLDLENVYLINNIGFAFGEALKKILDAQKSKNMGVCICSEKYGMCSLGLCKLEKKRLPETNIQIIGKPKFEANHLFSFFDGFAQGMGCDLSIFIRLSKNKGQKSEQVKLISTTFSEAIKNMLQKTDL